jgi:arylsulfatase A
MRTRPYFLVQLSLALVLSWQTSASGQSSKPNIVFILADDLGIGDVKCFGGDRCQIDTPHFDRLAKEGVMFTDAHAVAAVCVPSRVAIMTGTYPWRLKTLEQGGPWGFLGLRFSPERFTLGKMFQASGYRTGYVGKWHLGTEMATTDGRTQGLENVDYTKPLKIGPPQYGFDHSFILPGSLDMYPYVFARNNEWRGPVTKRRGWSAFNRVGPTADDFEDWKVLDTFSKEAETFIGRNSKTEKPFFLYLALTSPHTPTSPSPRFEGKSKIGIYGDFVMETDDCVGRVLKALDKHGLVENTLVIAASDHGPASYAGRNKKATFAQLKELEKDGHYSSGIYRGYKFSVYEGGHRVPFVARWPGVTKPGSHCNRLIGLNDMMRTFAAVAGLELESARARDSVSIVPLLKNPAAQPVRTSMIQQSTRPFIVRDGDWKLALCPGSGSHINWGNTPTAQEAWAAAVQSLGREPGLNDLMRAPFVQLFDLAADPGETKNLAASQPKRVYQMIALLRRETRDYVGTTSFLPQKPPPLPER